MRGPKLLLAGATLTALVTAPLAGSAALGGGAFSIKSQNAENPTISATYGMDGSGEAGPSEPSPEPTPEVPDESALVTSLVYNTAISGCTVPVLPIAERSGDVSISLNGGEFTPVTQDYPSLTGLGSGPEQRVDIKGKFAVFGTVPKTTEAPASARSKCITDVTKWGTDSGITKMPGAFYETANLRSVATIPSGVTDLRRTFNKSSYAGDLNSWDVSKVTSLYATFTSNKAIKDSSLRDWDTGNVTDMTNTFSSYTGDGSGLAGWDTSKVRSFSATFSNASNLKGGLSNWDTSSATDMNSMLTGTPLYNENLSKWKTDSVTSMSNMFYGADSFSGAGIENWNTGNVTTTRLMFSATAGKTNAVFNPDISGWDLAKNTDFFGMFRNTTTFNQDLSRWKTGSAVAMNQTFSGASSFSQDLTGWDVRTLTDPQQYALFDYGSKLTSAQLPKFGQAPANVGSGSEQGTVG